ncbi:UNVERIFIED_CONTAM: hypothetical protein H355_011168 [Colinus virginianus]|nr:hypothetical protein H355_011168 [Colinus virginianus]
MVETDTGVRCDDINECLSAACEGLCVNTEGGFVCECGPGMQLAANRHSCQDTDECLATPCQHRCKNSVGSYRCSCRPGYHLHGNRHSCVDVNECRQPGERRACQHACHNTPGSFLCSCRPGYRLSRDGVSCEGCLNNGVARTEGEVFTPSDGNCTICVCLADGSVSCKRTDCVETCPYPIHIPGQCCPDCSAGCTYMGRIFYNNETFPSLLDPCLSCICLLGSVACSPVDCAIFCTYPFHPEGECCPVCKARGGELRGEAMPTFLH